MAVNLSPLGGVGAQFFDNSGNPLTGGKIYTYAAGTTTPQTAYTSSTGSTPHTNPIILDAAGRVPGGEIWLTDGLQYKFVLKTSVDVLIATYDNIVGINSNFINYTSEQEIQTATAGQTVFTLTTMQYQPGTGSLSVFVDGVNQYGPGAQYAYVETDATTVTFISGLHVGASVKFTTSAINAASYGDAFQISYTPPFTGSVATNVGDKLAQIVNVVDFGADPTGVLDSSTAVQDAIDYVVSVQAANPVPGCQPATIYFPAGNYILSSSIDATGIGSIIGQSRDSVVLLCAATPAFDCGNSTSFQNIFFKKQTGGNTCLQYGTGSYLPQIVYCAFNQFTVAIDFQGTYGITKTLVERCNFDSCTTAIQTAGTCTTFAFKNNQCNTGTIVLDLANCFNFEITGNNFEDYTTPIVVNIQLVRSLIAGNWFEKSAAASVTPYTDNTVIPGFFTENNFAANRYISTNAPVYGVNSVVFDAGNVVFTPTNISGYANGRSFSHNSTAPTAVVPASAYPDNFTVQTQNAVASATSVGGDFIFRAGAGSNGQRYGSFRPYADINGYLGDASYRWERIYAQEVRPGAGTVIWTSGSGSPEGAVTAPVGSLYTRTDGGANTTLYVKESGTGNTGWAAK